MVRKNSVTTAKYLLSTTRNDVQLKLIGYLFWSESNWMLENQMRCECMCEVWFSNASQSMRRISCSHVKPHGSLKMGKSTSKHRQLMSLNIYAATCQTMWFGERVHIPFNRKPFIRKKSHWVQFVRKNESFLAEENKFPDFGKDFLQFVRFGRAWLLFLKR